MNNLPTRIIWVLTLFDIGVSCRPSTPSQDPIAERSSSGPGETGLTPGAPTPATLTELLGVQVDAAPGEINQYLIRSAPGSVDLSKVGMIHQDLGYAVGVTLPNGVQIGFRYAPAQSDSAPATAGSSSAAPSKN